MTADIGLGDLAPRRDQVCRPGVPQLASMASAWAAITPSTTATSCRSLYSRACVLLDRPGETPKLYARRRRDGADAACRPPT